MSMGVICTRRYAERCRLSIYFDLKQYNLTSCFDTEFEMNAARNEHVRLRQPIRRMRKKRSNHHHHQKGGSHRRLRQVQSMFLFEGVTNESVPHTKRQIDNKSNEQKIDTHIQRLFFPSLQYWPWKKPVSIKQGDASVVRFSDWLTEEKKKNCSHSGCYISQL